MLRIYIYGRNYYLLFDEQVENFTWSIKNPEGLPYQVSLPIITGNLLIRSSSATLDSITNKNTVEIRNSKDVIMFKLNVISCTFFKDEGKAELALEGKAFLDNRIGKGVFDLEHDYLDWSVYKSKIRFLPGRIPNTGFAIINNKQDYILSHLWGHKTLMNFAPTEFVGADKDYDYIEFTDSGEGIPEFEVGPEDIISFDISSAQPPITDLRLPLKINAEPVSDIPITEGIVTSKGFVIEGEINDHAVYVFRDIGIREELIWNSGHVIDLSYMNAPNIVGIFTDGFVIANIVQGTLQKYGKYSLEPVGPPVSLGNLDTYFDIATPEGHNVFAYTITTVVNGEEIMWVNTTTYNGHDDLLVGIKKDMSILTVPAMQYGNDISTNDHYYFASAYVHNEYVSAIYAARPEEGSEGFKYIRIKHQGGTSMQIDFAAMLPLSGIPFIQEVHDFDAFDQKARGTQDSIVFICNIRASGNYSYLFFVKEVGGVTHMDFIEGHFMFLDSGNKTSLWYDDEPIVKVNTFSNLIDNEQFHLLSNFSDKDIISSLYAVNFFLSRYFDYEYHRYRNNYIGVFDTGKMDIEEERIYRLIFLNAPVPWAKRNPSELTVSFKVNEGVENIYDLPFITTDLSNVFISPEEKGRIVLDLAAFDYIIDNIKKKADIQALEIPAFMSFIKFKLRENQTLRTLKVIGMDIEYRGVVRLRVHGIILNE